MKKFIPSLKGLRKGASFHVPPKRGPCGNTSISRALLSISFRVPSKGAHPPGSPQSFLGERCPIPRALSTYPVYEHRSRFPSEAPSRVLSQSFLRERLSTSRAPFIHLSRVPGKRAPFQFPRKGIAQFSRNTGKPEQKYSLPSAHMCWVPWFLSCCRLGATLPFGVRMAQYLQ